MPLSMNPDKSKCFLSQKDLEIIMNVFRIFEVELRSGLIASEVKPFTVKIFGYLQNIFQSLMKAMRMLGLNPTEWEVGV